MLLVLSVLALAFTFDSVRRVRGDLREACLLAALAWGVACTILTEFLGRIGFLSTPTLAAGWSVVALAAAIWSVRAPPAPLGPRPRLPRPSPLTLVLAAPVAAVVLLTALVANVGHPNNSDAMVYHLARAVHWAQNGSVDHYPTAIARQLFNPPWAEYGLLHALLLGGDDRFANLVQWLSMLGSLVGVSLVARQLEAGPRGQLLAALAAATLPMGILQASSTQNDYAVAFWLVCLAAALLAWRAHPEDTPSALAVGAALGLALLTKTTAYLYAPPLLVALVPARSRGRLRAFALVGLLALALNAPFWLRNLDLYRAPMGPLQPGAGEQVDGRGRVTNEAISPPILASNLLRNLAIHLGTPLLSLNRDLEHAIRQAHQLLGLDASDPRTTWVNFQFEVLPPEPRENTAGNLPHLLLVLVALAIRLGSRAGRRDLLAWRYAGALLAGFVLFCLVLKWQPLHSRLHLPLFVLGAPFVGLALEPLRPALLGAIALLLAAWCRPFLLDNWAHPLVGQYSIFGLGRADQYFLQVPTLRDDYLGAAARVRQAGCNHLGLILTWRDWEYPLWALFPEVRASGRIEHVALDDPSARLAARRPPFQPCALVTVNQPADQALELDGRHYRLSWSGSTARVYLGPQP